MFYTISSISKRNDKPNVLITISGRWMVTHPEEFAWLRSFFSKKDIRFTWLNHNFNHIYHKDIKPKKKFLLLPNTQTDKEILETEKQLIMHGALSSVFFRCHGLISNKSIAHTLISYGLIQFGAIDWISKLSKDYKIKNSDILLVYGNGNESKSALKKVVRLIQSNRFL